MDNKAQKKEKIIIFLYNRLFDPVIQSNFWLYIKDYLYDESSTIQFHLITYENPALPLSADQLQLVEEWKSLGLLWTPMQWNPGIGLKAKAIDIVQGFWAVVKLRRKGYKHVVSLASVAGTFIYMYSRLLPLKFFLYQYEPHSEYARDNGMWPVKSLQFKLSHWLERKSAHAAKVIASGTKFMGERLQNQWKVKAAFFKIPTVANDKKFTFDPQLREKVRKQLGFTDDQHLLFYPGKFGDLYYKAEAAWMFKWLKEEIPTLHFLIVTPHTDQEVIDLFNQAGVAPSEYTIVHTDYADIHGYYFAADFAVISVPPGPSKQFISNIKVGEYLCAGLPFLITKGVSEDYVYATEKNVGVVVEDFKEQYVRSAAPNIRNYLLQDKSVLRKHCREVGIDYRGFEKLNKTFKAAISHLIEN